MCRCGRRTLIATAINDLAIVATQIAGRSLNGVGGDKMRQLAAKRSTTALIGILLVSVVPARAASDTSVTAAADNALSRFEEAGLVPLTDDELAYITDPRTPRKAPPASLIRGRQLPDAREVSRSVEDSSALGPRAREDSSVQIESGDETRPKTSGRSVAEEPDPQTIVDYELAEITEVPIPREAPPTSPARRRDSPNTRGMSRPVDDPSALGFRAEENSGVKVESGVEAPPKASGRSAVEEEPDPRAVIDWLLKRIP
jgi:hypothetical protein